MISSYLNSACINHTNNLLLNFTNKLSKSLNIDQKELLEIWNNDNEDFQLSMETIVKQTSSTSSSKKEKKQCEYVNKRGEAKRCTCNVSEKSKTGLYCWKHAKAQEKDKNEDKNEDKKEENSDKEDMKETDKKEEKKTKTKPKSPPKKNKDDAQNSNEENKDKFKFRLKFNKNLNIYYDEKSTFVFDKSSKKVYAKFVDNEVIKLNQEDIDFFKKYSMEYDLDLFAKLYPEESEPGEDENEEEQYEIEEQDAEADN